MRGGARTANRSLGGTLWRGPGGAGEIPARCRPCRAVPGGALRCLLGIPGSPAGRSPPPAHRKVTAAPPERGDSRGGEEGSRNPAELPPPSPSPTSVGESPLTVRKAEPCCFPVGRCAVGTSARSGRSISSKLLLGDRLWEVLAGVRA